MGVTVREQAEPTDDAALVAASVDDPEAFAAIFARHHRTVHGYVARRAGTTVADDLLGEVFVRAFERRRSFDPAASTARPWLLGIATNLLHRHRRDEVRAWRAHARVGAREVLVAADHADAAAGRLDAGATGPALAGAVAAMSTADRDTLLLLAWGYLTYAEIAEALGVPVGTVRSRLHRARRQLRGHLDLPAGPTHEGDPS